MRPIMSVASLHEWREQIRQRAEEARIQRLREDLARLAELRDKTDPSVKRGRKRFAIERQIAQIVKELLNAQT